MPSGGGNYLSHSHLNKLFSSKSKFFFGLVTCVEKKKNTAKMFPMHTNCKNIPGAIDPLPTGQCPGGAAQELKTDNTTGENLGFTCCVRKDLHENVKQPAGTEFVTLFPPGKEVPVKVRVGALVDQLVRSGSRAVGFDGCNFNLTDHQLMDIQKTYKEWSGIDIKLCEEVSE